MVARGLQKSFTDDEIRDTFLRLIENTQFIPLDNQEEREGTLYSITLYDGEKTFAFSLSQIGKHYYYTEPDIYPIVDDFYKNLDVEKK